MGRKTDMFKFLPSEIMSDILLRIPDRSIASFKCVCRSLRDFVETHEFVNSHISRSAAALAVVKGNPISSRCSLFKIEDEINIENSRSHDHRYNHLIEFGFPSTVTIESSVNGLLLLCKSNGLCVCNPRSRQYIDLQCPRGFFNKKVVLSKVIYGFGVSKISGQYKVFRIVESENHCRLYTLGTGAGKGSWRRVGVASATFGYGYCHPAAFLNGKLHWLVLDSSRTPWISCLDLETECFSTLSLPPDLIGRRVDNVFAFRDCLCLCDHTFAQHGTVDIWLMKEYGVEKSWTKEYVIKSPKFDRSNSRARPIKVFKDDDILMQWGHERLFYYSNKMNKTIQNGILDDDDQHWFISSVLLTPSFLALRTFGKENVISL
ncbi:hypothetical protein OROMI_033719 [Orobanche minor]